MLVRPERPQDEDAVQGLHVAAFGPDHGPVVARLTTDLRASIAAEGGLSLVAVADDRGDLGGVAGGSQEHGTVVGHVMFTRSLLDAPERLVDVMVLSPLGVLPSHQGRGAGSALVRHGLQVLAGTGVPAVFLEGSPSYYGSRGFEAAVPQGFRKPSLRIPDDAFQVRLLPAHEPWMTGTLVYRHEFWDHDCVGLR